MAQSKSISDADRTSKIIAIMLLGGASAGIGAILSNHRNPYPVEFGQTVGEAAAWEVTRQPDADRLTPAQALLRLEQEKAEESRRRENVVAARQSDFLRDMGLIGGGTAAALVAGSAAASALARRKEREEGLSR